MLPNAHYFEIATRRRLAGSVKVGCGGEGGGAARGGEQSPARQPGLVHFRTAAAAAFLRLVILLPER